MVKNKVAEHSQTFHSSLDSVRDNPGKPVPEETFSHSHPLRK